MTLGLVLTAFTLGLRHGIDWDHMAAIADLSGSAPDRRRGFVLSLGYAFGHAVVVFVLGVVLLSFGASIPDGLDQWMGRVVGMTLVALGVWVIVELTRHGHEFRLRSRWMLVLDGTFAGLRRVRRGRAGRHVTVEHEHEHQHEVGADHGAVVAHDHAHVAADVAASSEATLEHEPALAAAVDADNPAPRGWRHRVAHRHHHRHSHDLALPDSAAGRYGGGTATGIGMLHGVGVESPTQIAIFVASTSVVGSRAGVLLLATWVVGLLVSNAALAGAAAFGVLHAERNFAVYRALAIVVAVASIAMGLVYLFELGSLPDIAV
mgnify:FL=1